VAELNLYTYYRSSAAWRVRIVLALKQLDYQPRYVHLLKDGGENWQQEYLTLNPQGLIPALQHEGSVITQSLAICEYLEELHPEPGVLPEDLKQRAYVRMLANLISCDIHPLNNLRVLQYLKEQSDITEATRKHWYSHWIAEGFRALEAQLHKHSYSDRCCLGNQPGLADACLIPQVYNAQRFNCDMRPYPIINAINEYCNSLPAFQQAAPLLQADANSSN